jgi:hypothetical protein
MPSGMWVSSIALDRRAPAEGPAAGKGIELKIRGQADEGRIRNPYELLRKIAGELGDPGAGVTAEASEYKASPRAGWGEFVFSVLIPQYVPAPEKPEGEEGQEEPAGNGKKEETPPESK